jgi:hypothetical protein
MEIKVEQSKCPKCGQILSALYWNSQIDIIVCKNDKCPAYRNPVSKHSDIKSTENKTLDAALKEIFDNQSRLQKKYRVSLTL